MEQNQNKTKYSLSVFLPFYNEEGNIRSAIKQTLDVLESMDELSAYEVIAVDDGSKDKTLEIAKEMAEKNSKIKVVSHGKNLGYGNALLSGIKSATYDYVFFTDGDQQFDISEIKKLTAYIPQYEVVIGYRAPRKDPFMRLLNAKGWATLNRFAFGLKVKDIDCAFKLFKRDVIVNIPLISGGAMLSAEMLVRIQKQGIEIKEVPVTHLPRSSGSPTGAKLDVIMRAFDEFWWIYRNTNLGNASYLQAIKFIMVGVVNTVVDVLIYYVLTRHTAYFPHHLLSTRGLSFLGGSICSFVLNRIWTFEKKDKVRLGELLKFYVTVGMSMVIGLVSMQLFMSIFHVYDLVALTLSIVFTFIWNFSISKLWVFSNQEKQYKTTRPARAL